MIYIVYALLPKCSWSQANLQCCFGTLQITVSEFPAQKIANSYMVTKVCFSHRQQTTGVFHARTV